MQKLGIDIHSLAGGCGFLAAGFLDQWSAIAGGCVATATAVYMSLRAWREWKKIKKGE